MKCQTISLFSHFFCCEGAMYHVAIATVIFSHVKITCYFHMWRYHVFARKLTWYFIGIYIINRGYYMAARRYEISLRVLTNISRVSAANEWNIFQHEKRNFVSPSGHVMFYLLYKHQWNAKPFNFNILLLRRRDVSCSHSNRVIFTCEDNMLFSRVKISCFRAKAHLVFHWCLYNKKEYCMSNSSHWRLISLNISETRTEDEGQYQISLEEPDKGWCRKRVYKGTIGAKFWNGQDLRKTGCWRAVLLLVRPWLHETGTNSDRFDSGRYD